MARQAQEHRNSSIRQIRQRRIEGAVQRRHQVESRLEIDLQAETKATAKRAVKDFFATLLDEKYERNPILASGLRNFKSERRT